MAIILVIAQAVAAHVMGTTDGHPIGTTDASDASDASVRRHALNKHFECALIGSKFTVVVILWAITGIAANQ